MAWVDIDYARSFVKQMYPSDKWRRRVRNMPDDQVLAIYYKHESDRHAKKITCKPDIPVVPTAEQVNQMGFIPDEAEQLSLIGIF